MTETSPQQPPDDLPDYGLVSDEGNARLDVVIRGVDAAVRAGSVERSEVAVALEDAVRELSTEFPEVTDITVRDAVLRELRPAFDAAGWAPLEPFEF